MTVVVDTSALVPALIDEDEDGRAARAAISEEDLIAPALLDVEVAHVLRGLALKGRLSGAAGANALARLGSLPIRRFNAVPLLPRIWELRENLSAYDATFVALAEVAGATLVTADARLARSSGPRCRFRLVEPGPA